MAAARFNEPQAPRAWREDMLSAGVPKPTRDQAWSVLSAALSWAAGSHLVPEIQTNGCGLANEPRGNRRRSMRHGGTGYVPARRHRGQGIVSWALSPQAVEAIRAEMLAPVILRHILDRDLRCCRVTNPCDQPRPGQRVMWNRPCLGDPSYADKHGSRSVI